MTADEIWKLAKQFLAGETSLGTDLEVELDRDPSGHATAMHAWPRTPQPIDTAFVELGAAEELPRLGPRSPRRLRYLQPGGIAILDVDIAARLVAMHAYRVAPDSLAGAITTEEHLWSLYHLLGALTRDAITRFVGRPASVDEWGETIDPRAGSNIASAKLEVTDGRLDGIQIEFRAPIAIDLARLGGEEPKERYFGNPPGIRKNMWFTGPLGTLSLTAAVRDDSAILDIVVRRYGKGDTPGEPAIVHAPTQPAPFLELAAAFFERSADEATIRAMLGGAPAHLAFAQGIPNSGFPDDRATFSIGASIDPALLEPHLGASWPTSSPHAYPSPLAPIGQRFPISTPAARGFLLVEPNRMTFHREGPDAWLGDFVRAEDLMAFIDRWLDDPRLTVDKLFAMVGHGRDFYEHAEDRCTYELVPHVGSNMKQMTVYFHKRTRIVKRVECQLWAPRAFDLTSARTRYTGPSEKLSFATVDDHIQYQQQVQTPDFLGVIMVNAVDRREGPIQLVGAMIFDKILPGEKNYYQR